MPTDLDLDLGDDAIQKWLEPLTNRRYRVLFGQHGIDLLERAEAGDPDAAGRLGLLLLCHDCPVEGLAWLSSAAACDDVIARSILDVPKAQRRLVAAEVAHTLAQPGLAQLAQRLSSASSTGAECYYRAAAQCGHADAAFHLAQMHLARDETLVALFLLRQAAKQGHPRALEQFQKLSSHPG